MIAKIAGAVIGGVAIFYGIKLLGGKKEDSPAIIGGGQERTFAGKTSPNQNFYNLSVGAPDVGDFLAVPQGEISNISSGGGSGSDSSNYYSTRRGSSNTGKQVNIFESTSATDVNRFASSDSGMVADRFAFQSVTPQEAARRSLASPTKKQLRSRPNLHSLGSNKVSDLLSSPTKKEERSEED